MKSYPSSITTILSALTACREILSRTSSLAGLLLCLGASLRAADSDPVWRVQLQVKVADASGAGTDDPIFVALNDKAWMYLNSSDNDFERNSEFTYDLLFPAFQPTTFADIEYLKIGLSGTDAVTLSQVTLIVNSTTVYSVSFTGGYTLFNSSIKFTSSTLRAFSGWKNYKATFPSLVIPVEQLELSLEGLLGHYLTGTEAVFTSGLLKATLDVKWGSGTGRGVEFSRYNSTTHSVDLDLAITGSKGKTDSTVDVDLRLAWSLVFTGASNKASLHMSPMFSNLAVDWDGLANAIDWFGSITDLEDKAYDTIIDRVNESIDALDIDLGITKSDLETVAKFLYPTKSSFSFGVEVQSDGDLALTFSAR